MFSITDNYAAKISIRLEVHNLKDLLAIHMCVCVSTLVMKKCIKNTLGN